MKPAMIRYKVKADRAVENEQYIAAVFAQLDREKPAGVRYATFRLEDGVSFVHMVSVETPDGNNPLLDLEAFQAFIAEVRDRCEEPPVVVDLHPIGAYRLFGDLQADSPH
jgi:hypothetical protein